MRELFLNLKIRDIYPNGYLLSFNETQQMLLRKSEEFSYSRSTQYFKNITNIDISFLECFIHVVRH